MSLLAVAPLGAADSEDFRFPAKQILLAVDQAERRSEISFAESFRRSQNPLLSDGEGANASHDLGSFWNVSAAPDASMSKLWLGMPLDRWRNLRNNRDEEGKPLF